MSDTRRVYVRAWYEPDAEYVRVPPGDLVPVIFDEPSDDELLPRLAWMHPEDVLPDAVAVLLDAAEDKHNEWDYDTQLRLEEAAKVAASPGRAADIERRQG